MNKIDRFPTVVAVIRNYSAFHYGYPLLLKFILEFVEKHRPKRILLSCNWLGYWCGESGTSSTCHNDYPDDQLPSMG